MSLLRRLRQNDKVSYTPRSYVGNTMWLSEELLFVCYALETACG